MSGFFGIFRPDGGQIDMDQFDRMKSAMLRDGYDGMETYVDGNIAVGHLMLLVGNASEFDKQPLKSDCRNYLLVGHFRLDYRDELGDKLGLTQMELEVTPDSKLVLMAYLKWKDKCVYHIEGDWVFVIYDIKKHEIYIYNSWVGNKSLFYYTCDNHFLFSSSAINIIQSCSQQFSIDIVRMLDIVASNGHPVDGKTLYKDLFYLKSGYTLKFNHGAFISLPIKVEKKAIAVRYKNEVDYKFDYFSYLVSAVKTKIIESAKTGIFLSAGLDSSAIGYILAKELNFLNKQLFSFTSVPLYIQENELQPSQNLIINESELVKEHKILHDNLTAQFVNYSDSVPLEIIYKYSKANPYYPVVNKNVIWISEILEIARRQDIRYMFNAQSGNFTISRSGSAFYIGLIFRFRFYSLLKLLIKQSNKHGFYVIIKNQILIPLVIHLNSFRLLRKYKRRSNSKYFRDVIKVDDKASWLNFFSNQRDDLLSLIPLERKGFIEELKFFEFVNNMWAFYQSSFSVCICDPTTDLRLVEFLNSIPESMFFKNLQRKYLYKKTFYGILPDSILFNQKRMIQSYDFSYRMSKTSKNKLYEILSNKNNYTLNFNDKEIVAAYNRIIEFPHQYLENYDLVEFLKVLSLRNFCNYESNH